MRYAMPPRFCREEAARMDDLLREATARLERAGDVDAEADARWLLCGCIGCTGGQLRFCAPPDAATRARYWAMVARRESGEPLQYILGDQPFCGRSFKADARALIPRPETEELCLKALELIRGVARPDVLDVGTGTGVLAVTIALERPDARVTGVDISPEALELARENAQALGAQVELRQGDLYAPVAGRAFDLIVSNPPYLSAADMAQLQREVRREPALALFGGADGLDAYRRLARDAAALLKPGGHIALEVGAGQAADVRALLAGSLADVRICRDINGVERIVHARRAE